MNRQCDLPRLSELAACSVDFASKLEDMSNPAKRQFFKNIETKLGQLPEATWADLKQKVQPYLKPARTRPWQQLYDRLNEAKGYNHLVKLRCTDIHFVPETTEKTPDLKGMLGNTTVLCEVKTVNVSDEEAIARAALQNGGHRLIESPPPHLGDDFLSGKFTNTLNNANIQMNKYIPNCSSPGVVRKIIFVILNCDDELHEYAGDYKTQLDEFVQNHNPVPGCDVEFFSRPPFFCATTSEP